MDSRTSSAVRVVALLSKYTVCIMVFYYIICRGSSAVSSLRVLRPLAKVVRAPRLDRCVRYGNISIEKKNVFDIMTFRWNFCF